MNIESNKIAALSLCSSVVLATSSLSPAAVAQTAHFSGVQTTLPTGSLNQPVGIAVDQYGNIYIADSNNYRVQKETLSAGTYTESTIATGAGQIWGIAVDSAGNVFFADHGNNHIWQATPNGSTYSLSMIPTSASYVSGLAVDLAGNLYIADTNGSRVLMETLSSGSYTESTIVTGLSGPRGVAVDGSGNIYIAETGNNRILKETLSSGSYTQSVVGSGLGGPWGVAADRAGNVYIADPGYGRILMETLSNGSYVQSTIPTSVLDDPLSIAVDGSGNVYVAQPDVTNTVLKESPPTKAANFGTANVGRPSSASVFFTFDTAGTIGTPSVVTQGIPNLDYTDAGTGTCTTNGTSHTYKMGEFCAVNVTFVPKFAGTRYGAAILSNASGSVIATAFAQGNGVGPQISFSPGNLSTLSLPGLHNPNAIAADSVGNLYIAEAVAAYDSGNAVVKETWNGSGYTQSTVAAGLAYPTGVAVDGAGNVYVSDQDAYTVYKYTPSPSGGYKRSTVDATLGTVAGLAVDGSGNVYIGRGGIGVEKETLTTAGIYNRSQIFSSFYGAGLAVDASGNLYICDGSSAGIRKETQLGTGYVESIIAAGENCGHLAIDSLGSIYFYASTQILKETPSGGNYVQTSLGYVGQNSLSVTVDGQGDVYFADNPVGRVTKLDTVDPPSLSFATTAYGSTSSDSPKIVTVANSGNAPLNFPVPGSGNNPGVSPSFHADSSAPSACPQVNAGALAAGTLAAGASCEFSVSFVPATVGAISGSLLLTDDSLNQTTATQTISLAGTGTSASPKITWAMPAAITYGTPLSNVQLNASSGGVAGTFVYSPSAGAVLPIGTQTLSVTFTPADTIDYTTASATASLVVNKATPALSLTSSAPNAFISNSVTFTATLATSVGSPAGTISFYDGTTLLGTQALNAGVATYTTSTLTAGTHSITAAYAGDGNFTAVTSVVVNEVVKDFTLASQNGGSATASRGGQATYLFSVAPPSGDTFPQAINFAVSGLPSGATAAFSPTSISAGSGATNVTLTVTLPSSAALKSLPHPFGSGALPLSLGFLLLPLIGNPRKFSRRFVRMSCFGLLAIGSAVLITAISGCGSGGSKSTPQPQNYTLSVTATSGSLSHTTTIGLTIN